MFKTARMRKIRIVTLDEYISPTVSALHEQGLVQINEISDSIQQDPELAELVTPSKASAFTGKLSSLLMKTSAISELLGNSLSEGHGIKDTIKSFISPEMPIQKEVGDLDTEALINKAEDLLAQVESETKVIEGKFSALDSETSVLTSNKSLAKRLYNLDMDLALLKDSKYTSITVGRINAESASEIESNLSKLTDELDVFIVPNDDKETANIIVVTLKEFGEDVYSTLRKFDFERVEVSNVKGTPQQIISSADSRLVTIESERNSAKSDLKAIAERWDDDILSLKEELENEKLNILRFPEISDAWLDFIAECRSGKTHSYDIVEGPMANDTVWNYVNDFLAGRINRKQFWVLAEFKYPTHQISFHTLSALDCLTFVKSEVVYDREGKK